MNTLIAYAGKTGNTAKCVRRLAIGRFKTGTPPRVLASSIDYDKTEIQPGDEAPNHFSFMSLTRII